MTLNARWFIAAALSLCATVLPAQTPLQPIAGQVRFGEAAAPLNGPWKFHIGDSPIDRRTGAPVWAEPDFDDSTWGPMDLTPPPGTYNSSTGASGFVPGWTARGYHQTAGYGWYRLREDVQNSNSAGAKLALKMPANFDDAYQVYANGRLIGQFGQFGPGGVKFYQSQPRSFLLPQNSAEGPVTFAVRMWMDPSTTLENPEAGGLHGPPVLGQAPVILAMQTLARKAVLRYLTSYFVEFVLLVLALSVAFALFWLDRSEPAYLLLGLTCAGLLVFVTAFAVLAGSAWFDQSLGTFAESASTAVIDGPLWVLFWAAWFRLEGVRRLHVIVWPLALLDFVLLELVQTPFYGRIVPLGAGVFLVHLQTGLAVLFGLLLIAVTVQGIRRNRVEGLIALPAVVIVVVALNWGIFFELHLPDSFHHVGTYIPIGQLGTIVSLMMITILLFRRFFLGQRERERMRQEMEQARTVQNVLIPDKVPDISGFRIECVYKPAGEVGGDFFQVLPIREGGAMICIGDVSGKGMPAAMTVSLLVGTLRTLAHYTQRPGEILSAMNQRMLGRSGFTTCLVMRVDRDGALTIANAGHLSPYLNGAELACENGLPLGLAAETNYAETRHQLASVEQLTLLTDGVVEARGAGGELFGFERTAVISQEPAPQIAQAAQAFGQEDDITVVAIRRTDLLEPALA